MAEDKISQQVTQLATKVDDLSENIRDTNTQMQLVCSEVKAVTITVDRLYNELHLPGVALTDTVASHDARLGAAEHTLRHHVEVYEDERARLQNNKWQLMLALFVAGLALFGTLATILTPIVMAKGTP